MANHVNELMEAAAVLTTSFEKKSLAVQHAFNAFQIFIIPVMHRVQYIELMKEAFGFRNGLISDDEVFNRARKSESAYSD